MMRRLLMFAAVFALGVAALTASAAYGAGAQVPIHGSYLGTAAFTSTTTVAFRGTGISSHLGRSTNQGNLVVTGPVNSCPGGLANVNTETFTAANGDTVTLTSHDVACPVAPGVYEGTGHFMVTGGAGRFRDATGQGTLVGHVDLNQGVFSFQFTGTISTPSRGSANGSVAPAPRVPRISAGRVSGAGSRPGTATVMYESGCAIPHRQLCGWEGGTMAEKKAADKATKKADGDAEVLANIAAMPEPDRAIAERLHAIVKANAPVLSPRLWYGMPAYAKDGKVVCFFQSAQKFKTRYATFGFQHEANLDEGAMWPVAFAVRKLTAAEEAKITALVKKAVS